MKTREKSCDLTLARVFEKPENGYKGLEKIKRKRLWYVEYKIATRGISFPEVG